MAWDAEERSRIEQVVSMLDEASAEFERLVAAKDAASLLEELDRLKLPDLRKILLARVLIEQRRGGDRSGPEQTPFGHDPSG